MNHYIEVLSFGHNWSKKLSKYSYIGFDFDGTLVDTENTKRKIISEIFHKAAEEGFKPEQLNYLTRSEICKEIASRCPDFDSDEILNKINIAMQYFYSDVVISDSVVDMIKFLNMSASVEIITAGNPSEVKLCLANNGLIEIPVFGANKNKEAVLKIRANGFLQSVYIGDSELDAKSAKLASMDFYLVKAYE